MKSNLTIYKFGDCELHTLERTVLTAGKQLEIPSKTFDVLVLLVTKYGETLSKNEILETVWGGQFVEEGNLTVHISKLRKLLKANKTNPFIKTIHGVGYQFVAAVTVDEDGSDIFTGSKTILISQPKFDSIAVLPLKNENGDDEIDYLADGLTESLINSLSYMPNFRVLARDTVFRYKDKDVNIQELGSLLGVSTVLTGRLRVINDNLIIGVELINVSDGTQLWGTQINQPFSDIFEMQKNLTFAISKNLQNEVSAAVKKSLPREFTQNTESYRFYLKGKHFLDKQTRRDLLKAIEYFRESISHDPCNPLSYIRLADCQLCLYTNDYKSYKESVPIIAEYLRKASEINSNLPELYVIKGKAARDLEWNLEKSEGFYRRGFLINPDHVELHQGYAHFLLMCGRFSETLEEMRILKVLDPISTVNSITLARLFYSSGQFENALVQLEEVRELEPENFIAYAISSGVLVEMEEYDNAIKMAQKALSIEDHPELLALVGFANARAGKDAKARNIIKLLEERSKVAYVSPMCCGIIFAALNEADEAFKQLELAYESHCGELMSMKINPRWATIKGDPRFNRILSRLELPAV